MKKSELVMKKLWLEKKTWIKSEEIRLICKRLNANYKTLLRYLLTRNYLIRIFKGVF